MLSHRKVGSLLALTKSGLKDWLLQRVSAVLIAGYFLFFVGFFGLHHPLNFSDWQALFANPFMKMTSLFILLMILIHAWIGIWTVLTDYLHSAIGRALIQGFIVIVFFACFISGISILWS